jgi:hypothetical protein
MPPVRSIPPTTIEGPRLPPLSSVESGCPVPGAHGGRAGGRELATATIMARHLGISSSSAVNEVQVEVWRSCGLARHGGGQASWGGTAAG